MKLKFIKLGVKLINVSYLEILIIGFAFWSITSIFICGWQLGTDLKKYHNAYDDIFMDIIITEALITISHLLSCAFISLILKTFKKSHKKNKKEV